MSVICVVDVVVVVDSGEVVVGVVVVVVVVVSESMTSRRWMQRDRASPHRFRPLTCAIAVIHFNQVHGEVHRAIRVSIFA